MLDKRYFQDGHLSSAALEALVKGELSPRDTQLLLIHLEHCPSCMDAYIAALDMTDLVIPPEDLQEQILERVEILSPSRTTVPLSSSLLRLAVAVALTVLLLFGNVFQQVLTSSEKLIQQITVSSEEPRKNPLDDFQKGFNDLINHFNDLFRRDAPRKETDHHQ